MPRTIEDLKRENETIISKQRALLDRAEKEKRGLTADEEKEYGELEADWAGNQEETRYLERNPTVQNFLASSKRPPCKPLPPTQRKLSQEEEASIRIALRKGVSMSENRMQTPLSEFRYDPNSREIRQCMNHYFLNGNPALTVEEHRALQADLDTAGGFLVLPVSMAGEFNKQKDNYVVVRKAGARQLVLENATSLGVPSLANRMAVPTWTSEIRTGTEDTTMSLDGRQLSPHPLAKRIKVSEKLMRIASINPEDIVREEFAYQFGTTEDNAFLTGSGQNQPLGVFTVSKEGINTDRDVTSEVAATVKADDLIEVVGTSRASIVLRQRG